jgi:hypothetical protein
MASWKTQLACLLLPCLNFPSRTGGHTAQLLSHLHPYSPKIAEWSIPCLIPTVYHSQQTRLGLWPPSSTSPPLRDIPTSILTSLYSQNQAVNFPSQRSLQALRPRQTSPTILSSRRHRSPSLLTTSMEPTSPRHASLISYPTSTASSFTTHPLRGACSPRIDVWHQTPNDLE